MAIGTEGIGTVAVIVTEINVIEIAIGIGIAAVVITRTPEATTKDRWSGSGTTGTVAVVVKTMIE